MKKSDHVLIKHLINKKPIFRLISAPNGQKLLYDNGTNNILKCSSESYDFIKCFSEIGIVAALERAKADKFLAKGAKETSEAIISHNIFQQPHEYISFGNEEFTLVNKSIQSYQTMMSLEVTDACNFRCKYCIHSDYYDQARSHGSSQMSWDTAKKAIDLFHKNSKNAEDEFLTIAFYGGEPLLNFKIIKNSTDYAKMLFKDRRVRHSITTNAYLLTKEICQYFAEHKFEILVSIDGPKAVHDENRIDKNGDPTFDRVISNLLGLIEIYDSLGMKGQVSLSMVYAPPFSPDKYNLVNSLWTDYPKLKDVTARITYPSPEGTTKKIDNTLRQVEEIPLDKRFKNEYDPSNESSDFKFSNIIEKRLARICQRQITKRPPTHLYPNGCCVPGVRRFFVQTDGEFRICEKMQDAAPTIGNIASGIDLDKLKRIYVDEYMEFLKLTCSKCWGNRLCSLCYTTAYENRVISAARRGSACQGMLLELEDDICFYNDLIEKNEEIIDHLLAFKVF